MQQGFIKTAAVTPKIRVADPAYNAQVILEKLEEAWEHGPESLCFLNCVLPDTPAATCFYSKSCWRRPRDSFF